MNIVFFRLDEFIHLHTRIVECLRATKNDVGKVLMQYFADFSVYREYCVRLSKVQTILTQEELRSLHTIPLQAYSLYHNVLSNKFAGLYD
jgi:hypothetical protein